MIWPTWGWHSQVHPPREHSARTLSAKRFMRATQVAAITVEHVSLMANYQLLFCHGNISCSYVFCCNVWQRRTFYRMFFSIGEKSKYFLVKRDLGEIMSRRSSLVVFLWDNFGPEFDETRGGGVKGVCFGIFTFSYGCTCMFRGSRICLGSWGTGWFYLFISIFFSLPSSVGWTLKKSYSAP